MFDSSDSEETVSNCFCLSYTVILFYMKIDKLVALLCTVETFQLPTSRLWHGIVVTSLAVGLQLLEFEIAPGNTGNLLEFS